MTTNTPEPTYPKIYYTFIESQFTGEGKNVPAVLKEDYDTLRSTLQAERERAEKAEAELAALEVKTWNAAIEAAAEGFELDDGHYYDQVRESILRLKK